MHQHKHTAYQNSQNAAKAVLRKKFIALSMYIRKEESSQVNNLSLTLTKLEKEEQNKPKQEGKKNTVKKN